MPSLYIRRPIFGTNVDVFLTGNIAEDAPFFNLENLAAGFMTGSCSYIESDRKAGALKLRWSLNFFKQGMLNVLLGTFIKAIIISFSHPTAGHKPLFVCANRLYVAQI